MTRTGDGGRAYATVADIQSAIEALALTAQHRVYRAAQIHLVGSEYNDPRELIGEAVKRCMNAAVGEGGRPWPLDVPFEAFMIQTMEGLASDSRDSWHQRARVETETLVLEGQSADDALAHHGHLVRSVEDDLADAQERGQHEAHLEATVRKIVSHFQNNLAVSQLIEGKLAGLSAAETREMFDMTEAQYENAHRAFRRGLAKLFPDRDRSRK